MNKPYNDKDANLDPISKAPGAHPVGTGVGAIGGGAAAGAAAGTVVGPAGTAVGAAAGAIVGGLAGKGVAEKVNPTHVGRLIGYDVQDGTGDSVGTVHSAWTDEAEEPVFLGVKTGWLFGKTHIVPVHTSEVNDTRRLIKLPFTTEQIKGAPAFDADSELSATDVRGIYDYYGVYGARAPEASSAGVTGTTRSAGAIDDTDQATVPIREENIKVGKREVAAGGVRLRRVVHTETVNQPVELTREDVVVERVPASEVRDRADTTIGETDVFIPLRRQEAVVQKELVTTGAVRVRKTATTHTEEVSDEVRKEDVKVERDGNYGRSI